MIDPRIDFEARELKMNLSPLSKEELKTLDQIKEGFILL